MLVQSNRIQNFFLIELIRIIIIKQNMPVPFFWIIPSGTTYFDYLTKINYIVIKFSGYTLTDRHIFQSLYP